MTFFPKKPIIAGVDFTSTSTKVVLLTKKRGAWVVLRLEEFPRDVNLLDIIPKEAVIVSSLSTKEVLVRGLDLPLKKEKDILRALEFQAEPLLPFSLEKAILQFFKVENTQEGSTSTLLAIKKDNLFRHLEQARSHKIEPEVVSVHPLALAALTKCFEKKEERLIVLHLSEKEGSLLLIQDGHLIASKAFDNEKFEIQKNLAALLSHPKARGLSSIYLLSEDPFITQEIQGLTEKTIILPKCKETLDENLQKYAIALGSAFAMTEKKVLSFRQKEYIYPHFWKKAQKPLFAYFALSACLFLALFAWERNCISSYEKNILADASSIVSKPENRFDLQNKLIALEKEMEKSPDTFPLLPQIPRVSDVLAWLSNDFPFDSITILGFNYSMVSRPTFEKKNDHYQVKVELSFKTNDINEANAFHEFLLHTNPYSDSKKEVGWTSEKGIYRTTFFLKDKTRYT